MISALPNKTFYQMSLSCWKICFQNTREAAKGGLSVWVGISGSTVCLGGAAAGLFCDPGLARAAVLGREGRGDVQVQVWGVQWAAAGDTDKVGAGEAPAGSGGVACANHRQGVLHLTVRGCSFSHLKRHRSPAQVLS